MAKVLITDKINEGIISEYINNYIQSNYEYPNANAMNQIYKKIAGNNEILWKKLQ